MPTIESRLVEIAGELRGETERAYRLYDGKTTAWVAIEFEPTKDGILRLLNRYAGHADNG